MAKKTLEKYTAWLKCEGIRFDNSKTGNSILIADFRDNQNRLYRHYISNNSKSQVWIKQLFAGLKPVTFEELEISFFAPYVGNVEAMEYFNFVRDRVYQVVFVKNSEWSDNRVLIVSEVYARHVTGYNYNKAIENFEKGVQIRRFI